MSLAHGAGGGGAPRLHSGRDVLREGRCFRDGQAVFLQAFDVKPDCVTDLALGLFHGVADGDTTGKVGDIGRVFALGFSITTA